MNLNNEHKALLELLSKVTDIFSINSIQYYLVYGSAIGAVREHNIIAWDDDIDIGMSRDSFDIAIKKLSDSHLPDVDIYIPSQSDSYFLPYAKVVCKVPQEEMVDDKTGITGAFIDIFPLDHTSEVKWIRELHQFEYRIGRAALLAKGSPDDLSDKWGKLGRFFLKKYATKTSYKRLFKNRDKFIRTSKLFKHSSVLYNFGTPYAANKDFYYSGEITSCKFFSFGDQIQPVPIGYDTLLTRTYGDYMSPPANQTPRHMSLS